MSNCDLPHDPEPYVQYVMNTGQTGMAGGWKFRPRPGCCQDYDCYQRTLDV